MDGYQKLASEAAVASEIIYTSEFSSRALSTYVPGNIYKFRFRITTRQKVLWPHTWALQASQAEIFPGNLKIESGKPGRVLCAHKFCGHTELSHCSNRQSYKVRYFTNVLGMITKSCVHTHRRTHFTSPLNFIKIRAL